MVEPHLNPARRDAGTISLLMAQVLVVDDSTTVRKVVSRVLEDRGHAVVEAVDGEDALTVLSDPEFRADVVLVDFVMPKMNGFQFCQKLRADIRIADTPVVLMSAKADRLRDRFMQQTGALDAITKPFDPEALVAVIDQALLRRDRPTNRSLEGTFDSELPPSSVSAAGGESTRVGHQSSRTTIDKLAVSQREPMAARLIADQIASAAPEGLLGGRTRDEYAAIMTSALGRAALESLWHVLMEHVGADLSGRMENVPFGAVLQMLSMEQRTGVLACESGGGRITIALRNGLVDLARSENTRDEFRLGRYFLEKGVLTQSQLDSALGDAPVDTAQDWEPPPTRDASEIFSRPLLLGDRLRAKSLVTEEQLLAALARQSSELVYEVLRWTRGHFAFLASDTDSLAVRAELGLPMAQVVMEGFRRVDEWRALEQALGDFATVLARDDLAVTRLHATELPADERAVLEAVDGRRSIREVIAKSHLSSFDACRVLVQLLEARLVRRRFG